VRLVDGATVSLADTEANRAAYPQPRSQQPGLGFPLCRVVGLLCLGSGALLAAASGPCEGKGSDEHSLCCARSSMRCRAATSCLGTPCSRPIACSASWCTRGWTESSSTTGRASAAPTSAQGE